MLGSSYRACGELEEAEPSNGFMLGIVHRLRDCKHPVAGANHGAYANHTTVITVVRRWPSYNSRGKTNANCSLRVALVECTLS